MKKKLLLTCLLLIGSLVGCSSKENTITVLATLEPHGTILEAAKPLLEEKGYTLKIEILDDYYMFNKIVDGGDADANYFQHIPFFNGELEKGYDLVNVAGIHIEPFGFYSQTISSKDELKKGDKIVISNSVADNGRILSILEKAGIIEIRDGVDVLDATLDDISSNPLELKFIEIKPELLVSAYKNNEGAMIAINGNYAIAGGLNPVEDAVILEQADSTNPYVNIVACRSEDKDSPKIKALVEVLTSQEIKDFISKTYSDGSVIPAE